jgi:uncharacterized protein
VQWKRLRNPDLIPAPVRAVVESIANFPEVDFIVIFGSRAIGDADDRSDIDICVSAPRISLRRWLALKQIASSARTLLWITVVRFEDSPKELQERNLEDGTVVYERKKAQG